MYIFKSKSIFKKNSTISENDVISAYELFLDRKPESQEAINNHLQAKSHKELIFNFIRSPEFISKNYDQTLGSKLVEIGDPKVDVFISDENLQQCLQIVKSSWTHLGLTKPHFSVLTDANYLPEKFANNSELFWQSGENEKMRILDILKKYHIFNFEELEFSELGCGVGRITNAVAKVFKSVNGYDISSNHIDIAINRSRALNINNIKFDVTAESPLSRFNKTNIFYSRIVLQHNPPPIIYILIDNMLKALEPGGLALFQVPTFRVGYEFNITKYLSEDHALDMQMHFIPQRFIFDLVKENQCKILEVREDNSIGMLGDAISNLFIVMKEK
jgi:SAM-dependent methyltransferase